MLCCVRVQLAAVQQEMEGLKRQLSAQQVAAARELAAAEVRHSELRQEGEREAASRYREVSLENAQLSARVAQLQVSGHSNNS